MLIGHLYFRTASRSEEHTSELQSQSNLVCRLLIEKSIHGVLNPTYILCVRRVAVQPAIEAYSNSLHDALPILWRERIQEAGIREGVLSLLTSAGRAEVQVTNGHLLVKVQGDAHWSPVLPHGQ